MTMDFHPDKCTLCGECFHQCPVMELPLERSISEMKKLLDGKDAKTVLRRCESCMYCNQVCPEGVNPAYLIMNRWYEMYSDEGLPLRAEYYLPLSQKNFRTYVLDRLPEDEKALLESWKDETPTDEIFYPGCNWITVPYLSRTKLMEGMDIRGSLDVCCGEMYFRMGHFDELRQVAARLTAHYEKMGIKRMIIPCTAGYNLFTNILPRFGARFSFTVKHFLPMLYERIASGELAVERPLGITATIQESCHAKFLGDEFMDIPRRLLSKIGVEVVEMEKSRDRMLCCGIGGGFSHPSAYHPFDVLKSTVTAVMTARRARTDVVATYCAGCMQTYGTGRLGFPLFQTPTYHIMELVQMAIGEEPLRRNRPRARTMFLGIMRNQMPTLLSRRRFRSDPIKTTF